MIPMLTPQKMHMCYSFTPVVCFKITISKTSKVGDKTIFTGNTELYQRTIGCTPNVRVVSWYLNSVLLGILGDYNP